MGKFRKKPVVIDAVQFKHVEDYIQVVKLAGKENQVILQKSKEDWQFRLLIPTLEGEMVANKGDWIIKGVRGEVYPCKPDIFEATYEKAT